MAEFIEVMEVVFDREHNNRPDKILHYNKKESNYTLYGIYPYTKLPTHMIAYNIIRNTKNIKEASIEISKNIDIYNDVLVWYYHNFYSHFKLDEVKSNHIATEIMVFAINVGIGRKEKIIKNIQRIVGVKQDGIIGAVTLKALNGFDEKVFDKEWDKFEISFYKRLVNKYSRLKWALKGWINRAKAV
jgi:hypothetical protein